MIWLLGHVEWPRTVRTSTLVDTFCNCAGIQMKLKEGKCLALVFDGNMCIFVCERLLYLLHTVMPNYSSKHTDIPICFICASDSI